MASNFYGRDFRLGILGGGQLGKMLIQQALNYDLKIHVLDPSPEAPCSGIAHSFTVGRFDDYETVYEFGKNLDLLTIEIEHVNLEALNKLVQEGVEVHPHPSVLRVVQDKGLQKQFYRIHGIDTAPFVLVENVDEIKQHRNDFPFMQKLRKGGYDGRGVQALKTDEDLYAAMPGPSVLEKFVDFEKEISVIVARSPKGEMKTFPAVDMVFNSEANLVEFLYSPSSITPKLETKARELACKVAEAIGLTGVLAVEMFVTKTGGLLVNEVAPRPHNSGHQTIEGNVSSQYEQHLRAILNLPLGDTSIIRPTVMVNLLGEKGFSGPVKYEGIEKVLMWPGVHVHLYGKSETKPFRKMGHVTVASDELSQAKALALKVQKTLRVISNGSLV
ncbi:MAG: 5-(carboxyamino)imidazole ribonucleotide synthase [Flavobacteriales bacterium]|nr:5-(carboxyamino)imidazole ribonucleotide synthase [Flavobacteriales bacterium]